MPMFRMRCNATPVSRSPANEQLTGLRKGAWTHEEDLLLKKCVEKYGEGKWRQVPTRAGLRRCRKSCRLRWLNYLRPNIKRGEFSDEEVDLIVRLHKLLGNRWSLIAGRIPGRTANDIKNHWNAHISKKFHRLKSGEKMDLNKDRKPAAAAAAAAATATASTVAKAAVAPTTVIKPQPRTLTTNPRWLEEQLNSTTNMAVDGGAAVLNYTEPAAAEEQQKQQLSWWVRLLEEEEEEGNRNSSILSSGMEMEGGVRWEDYLFSDENLSRALELEGLQTP